MLRIWWIRPRRCLVRWHIAYLPTVLSPPLTRRQVLCTAALASHAPPGCHRLTRDRFFRWRQQCRCATRLPYTRCCQPVITSMCITLHVPWCTFLVLSKTWQAFRSVGSHWRVAQCRQLLTAVCRCRRGGLTVPVRRFSTSMTTATTRPISTSGSVVHVTLYTVQRPGFLPARLCKVRRCWRRRLRKLRTDQWFRLSAKQLRSQRRNAELLRHHLCMRRSLSDSGSLRRMLDVLHAAVQPPSLQWSQADYLGPSHQRYGNLVLQVPSSATKQRSCGRWLGTLCAMAAGRRNRSDEGTGSVEVSAALPDHPFHLTATKPNPPTLRRTCRTQARRQQFTVHCRSVMGRWTSGAARAVRRSPTFRGRHKAHLCLLLQFIDPPSAPRDNPPLRLFLVERGYSLRWPAADDWMSTQVLWTATLQTAPMTNWWHLVWTRSPPAKTTAILKHSKRHSSTRRYSFLPSACVSQFIGLQCLKRLYCLHHCLVLDIEAKAVIGWRQWMVGYVTAGAGKIGRTLYSIYTFIYGAPCCYQTSMVHWWRFWFEPSSACTSCMSHCHQNFSGCFLSVLNIIFSVQLQHVTTSSIRETCLRMLEVLQHTKTCFTDLMSSVECCREMINR